MATTRKAAVIAVHGARVVAANVTVRNLMAKPLTPALPVGPPTRRLTLPRRRTLPIPRCWTPTTDRRRQGGGTAGAPISAALLPL
jgi:hypothetical protein